MQSRRIETKSEKIASGFDMLTSQPLQHPQTPPPFCGKRYSDYHNGKAYGDERVVKMRDFRYHGLEWVKVSQQETNKNGGGQLAGTRM